MQSCVAREYTIQVCVFTYWQHTIYKQMNGQIITYINAYTTIYVNQTATTPSFRVCFISLNSTQAEKITVYLRLEL